jgi:uncharacterized membrane protein YdjX (TVP38/TMEM64 family)
MMAAVEGSGTEAAAGRRLVVGRLALIVAGIALVVLAGQVAGPAVPRFSAWVAALGPWGPAVYVLGYVVACVAFVPGALPTMAAGALFGLGMGTLYAFVGETLGGIAAFLVARRLARPLVERRLAGTPTFAALDRAVAAQGLRIVFLLRLSPLFPFNFLNYALGITSVRLGDYAVASLGMLPGAFLYVYYGKLIGDVAKLASGQAAIRGVGYWAVLACGLAATVAVSALIARIATHALRDAAAEASGAEALVEAAEAFEHPPADAP